MSLSAELKPVDGPSQPAGLESGLWQQATPEQQRVLTRIARQRARLKARAAAKAQAQALRQAQPSHVDAEASLPERVWTFVRLHPVATAAAGALLMVAGPRRLMRWGSVALPWVMKLQQRSRG